MIKMICLVKRKSGLSREEFVEYYERNHIPLAASHMPLAVAYTRRYLGAGVAPHWAANGEEPDYDVITEIWFETQDDVDKTLAGIALPEVAAVIIPDEDKFLDRDKSRMLFVVEERNQIGTY